MYRRIVCNGSGENNILGNICANNILFLRLSALAFSTCGEKKVKEKKTQAVRFYCSVGAPKGQLDAVTRVYWTPTEMARSAGATTLEETAGRWRKARTPGGRQAGAVYNCLNLKAQLN